MMDIEQDNAMAQPGTMPAIGDTVYFAAFDENFPGGSEAEPHKVEDVSAKGKLFLDDGVIADFNDPETLLFLTREEAEAKIGELRRGHEERMAEKERKARLIDSHRAIEILEKEIAAAEERERGCTDIMQGIAAGAQKAALRRALDEVKAIGASE